MRPAYEEIAAVLVEEGTEEVFGLMGDDTARLVAALTARGVRYHNARHENAAVAMATGYATAAGRLGVCVISRGPGTTNALTGLVNAARAGAPVLVVTGDEAVAPDPNTVLSPDGKAIDAAALAAGCGVPTYTPRSAAAVGVTVSDAAARAATGRTVLLTVPVDLFAAEVGPATPGGPVPARPAPAAARPAAVAAAVAVLGAARHPLVVAGAGAVGARPELEALADRTGAVLATSLGGKDLFHGHPLDAGMIGSFSHSAGRTLMERSDALLVVGASLNQHSTTKGRGLPAVPLVHVDADRRHIGRHHWADVAVVGDARTVVAQLLDALPPATPACRGEARALLAAHRPTDDFDDASTRWTIDPRTLVLELDRLLPADRTVVTDNGNFFGNVAPHITAPSPDRFVQSSHFAVIGLGLGAAVGTALARPGSATVAFVGDGGLLMSLGELETLARLDLPLVVVVMNDCAYGAERHFLELRRISGRTAMFPDTDFAAVAAAIGIASATVRTVEELRALGPELTGRDGPLLLDCKITPTVAAPFLS